MFGKTSDTDEDQPQTTRRKAIRKAAGGLAAGGALASAAARNASAKSGSVDCTMGYCDEKDGGWAKYKGGFNAYEYDFHMYLAGTKIARFNYNWTETCYRKKYSFSDKCGNSVSGAFKICTSYKGNCEWKIGSAMSYNWQGWGDDVFNHSERIKNC